jgi:hypothetical protein
LPAPFRCCCRWIIDEKENLMTACTTGKAFIVCPFENKKCLLSKSLLLIRE